MEFNPIMHCSNRFNESIQYAKKIIPVRLHGLLKCNTYIDFDVVNILHNFAYTDSGDYYGAIAHVAYPVHINHNEFKDVSMVLYTHYMDHHLHKNYGLAVLIHELGHVLDYHTGFKHCAVPVNDYALTNDAEAYAEAFTAYILGSDYLNEIYTYDPYDNCHKNDYEYFDSLRI